jgi:hypothetical protein
MSPDPLPDCGDGTDPSSSMGTGSAANEGELAGCLLAIESGAGYNPQLCPWFAVPPKPGSSAAREQQATQSRRERDAFLSYCSRNATTTICAPFVRPLGSL